MNKYNALVRKNKLILLITRKNNALNRYELLLKEKEQFLKSVKLNNSAGNSNIRVNKIMHSIKYYTIQIQHLEKSLSGYAEEINQLDNVINKNVN